MKKHYLLLLGLFLCVSASSVSAQQMFMKVDNLTVGGSTDRDYEDYVEISSVQNGIEAETSITTGGGTGVGKPRVNEIIITKGVDKLTPRLMEKIAVGRTTASVEIVNVWKRSPEEKGQVMYKVELKDVFVTEISNSSVQNCPDGCPGLAESVKLVFKAIRITTYSVDRFGEVKANAPFMFDVSKGTLTF